MAPDGERPRFIAPSGRPDTVVNLLWRQPTVRTLLIETVRRYTFSVKVWLDFLHARQASWEHATAVDVESFKVRRLSADESPRRVSAATFWVDLTALRRWGLVVSRWRGCPATL